MKDLKREDLKGQDSFLKDPQGASLRILQEDVLLLEDFLPQDLAEGAVRLTQNLHGGCGGVGTPLLVLCRARVRPSVGGLLHVPYHQRAVLEHVLSCRHG